MIRFLFALLLLGAGVARAETCSECTAAGGTYKVLAPAGWDGRSPLGVLMFIHGYMMEGGDIIEDAAIRDAAAARTLLLVAPDGLLRSWAHVGSPSQARDEIAFLRGVLADVGRRWPIDRRTVIASGFSQGASMVWDLACYAAGDFTAFLPFSGGFWEPMPTGCTSGPVELRHVHGSDDKTMPLAGRALFGPYRQGDIRKGFARWVAEDRCEGKPVMLKDWADLTCESYGGCGSQRRLQLCTRPGGHQMWAGDVLAGLRWATAR